MHAKRAKAQSPRPSAAINPIRLKLDHHEGMCVFLVDMFYGLIMSIPLGKIIRSIGLKSASIHRKLRNSPTNRMEDEEVIRQETAQTCQWCPISVSDPHFDRLGTKQLPFTKSASDPSYLLATTF